MSWYNKDDLRRRGIDRFFVSCDEEYEKEKLVKWTVDKYALSKEVATELVEKCCKKVTAPRDRKAFEECIYLEVLKKFHQE
ncbi:hypothetical protein Theam_1796 (plasmid) [Thermovibrio ammonificans HB-1]|uniref:Uncharacterized protein n=1 Tax=Thermovibrio ammonificans (strain DSM 15698 / JCM 12110 / HB-1) TaxID=648996 RepID=E8T6S9_THEA1|nr:hypothetical protein [Thermovibrio ammonificans]ADU97752.1 hypothetical protein Theam_1796 [Thermovibrio ammonificans HB-1]